MTRHSLMRKLSSARR